MAAAIGHPIDIPIVIRALAADFRRWEPGTDFPFDGAFLVSLDAGTEHDDPAKIVTSYQNPWWSARKDPPTEDLLNSHNFTDFINHHRSVSQIPPPVPNPLHKPSYTWSRGVTFGSAPPKLDCDRCRLYRAITISALDELRDLRHHAHALEVRYAANSASTSRRAANFYQLYETSLLKDSYKRPKTVPKHPKFSPDEIRTRAEKELRRLEQLPKLKWTSGFPLSPEEVIIALKPHSHSGPVHSGYVTSLPPGTWEEDSIADGSPFPNDADRYSDAHSSQAEMSELGSRDIPIHFTFPPLRHFHSGPPRLGLASDASHEDSEGDEAPSHQADFFVPDPPPFVLPGTLPGSVSCPTSSASPEGDPVDYFPLQNLKSIEPSQVRPSPAPQPGSKSGSHERPTSSVSSEEVSAVDCFPLGGASLPRPTHAVTPESPSHQSRSDSGSGAESDPESESSSPAASEAGPDDAFPDLPSSLMPSHNRSHSGSGAQTDPESDSSSKASSEAGPEDAFPELPSPSMPSHDRSHSGSGSESDPESDSSSETSSEAGPDDAFPELRSPLMPSHNPDSAVSQSRQSSDSETESDSLYEVSATEAAAALADSDDNVGVGGLVLAALLGGQLDVETNPPPSNPSPDAVRAGPFTAEWFAPLNLEALYDSSHESDSD